MALSIMTTLSLILPKLPKYSSRSSCMLENTIRKIQRYHIGYMKKKKMLRQEKKKRTWPTIGRRRRRRTTTTTTTRRQRSKKNRKQKHPLPAPYLANGLSFQTPDEDLLNGHVRRRVTRFLAGHGAFRHALSAIDRVRPEGTWEKPQAWRKEDCF